MRELKTRDDMAMLLLDWIRPLKKYYSEGGAQLLIGDTSAHYGENSIRMEGYSRVLWGLGPLFAGDNRQLPGEARQEIGMWKELTRRGLIHGTDPGHEEYWQDVGDYDQKMVEMAAVANAILLAPQVYWEPLSESQRQNVFRWLNMINCRQVHANNWRFFRVLVNVLFQKLGLLHSASCLEEDLGVVEHCYEGDGWYFDGHPGQKDYYIPFAMHYYGLIYAEQMKDREPEYCRRLRERAEKFYQDFVYWFDRDGREVPYGRSLTYRFAHSAVFAAMAFAGAEAPMGQLRALVLGNLRYWGGQPIFDRGGILTIGYQYPNLIMSERYNAPGSPYWSFKTFLALALSQEHPFWKSREEKPTFKGRKYLKHPYMISVHEDSGHALLYPTGQESPNFGNTVAKYQKFVYSNRFGFSVSRGTQLEDGAFDNTLAGTAAGENFWRMRGSAEKFEVTEVYTRTLYELLPGAWVESVIIPLEKGHVRVHFLRTEKRVELADGGFAIPLEEKGLHMDSSMVELTKESCRCRFPWGNAGAVCLTGNGRARQVIPFPNTNLMYGITLIPTICYMLEPGEYSIADYFYGDGRGQREEEHGQWEEERWQWEEEIPRVEVTEEAVRVICPGRVRQIQGKRWL